MDVRVHVRWIVLLDGLVDVQPDNNPVRSLYGFIALRSRDDQGLTRCRLARLRVELHTDCQHVILHAEFDILHDINLQVNSQVANLQLYYIHV